MKKKSARLIAFLLLFVCLCSQMTSAAAETVSNNPLLGSLELQTAKTPQRFTNILLLGIDFGYDNYVGSAYNIKTTLEDCHTDTVMVVSINMTTGEVNLVSLPRDTLTYVPGVRGIYKLNGAFNCADTLEEGFQRTRDAASWLLGGIQIDHFCAVDMGAMVKLGDFIGGVDMKLEMSYTGHSGRKYRGGMQHLDGLGITDYLRARKNATVNGTDLGRTSRNRDTMIAIFQKIKSDPSLIKSTWDYATSGEINFYTDMSLAKALNLLNKIRTADTIGSHVITGTYMTALDGWNFTFTNQAHRIEVIKEVYGIDVKELPYVSYAYGKWLMEEGFRVAKYTYVANDLLEQAKERTDLTASQQASIDSLEKALDETIQAFDIAADTMQSADQRKLVNKRQNLRNVGNEVAIMLTGAEAKWSTTGYWYQDPAINEYQYSWE